MLPTEKHVSYSLSDLSMDKLFSIFICPSLENRNMYTKANTPIGTRNLGLMKIAKRWPKAKARENNSFIFIVDKWRNIRK